MEKSSPEKIARKVVNDCADCDVCRFLMDTDCLVFPELYRLNDKEVETGQKITSEELRNLVDLCNFCALCPCPPVRADIVEAKTRFIDRDGLKYGVRTLEDVERVAKLCGAYPRLTNKLLSGQTTGSLFKMAAGIHKDRKIPEFPEQNFPLWARDQGLTERHHGQKDQKVAYFAGCTANYLFPEVPRAVVDVLRINDIDVYFPEQKCCGMPSLLEGDRQLTLKFVRANMDFLAEVVQDGYDIVCSCPTCGFMLRSILKEGAYYSTAYQDSVSDDAEYIQIPVGKATHNPQRNQFKFIKKSIYGNLFRDDGYFSSVDPLKRIMVAENTFDLGDYLVNLHRLGKLKASLTNIPGRIVYYPPCHLREQNIGRPYLDLLKLIPGISLEPIDDVMDCCGMAGIMGFKKEFHESSLHLGQGLMEKIKQVNPQLLVTDCLSCRLQFDQLLPYPVSHPIEVLIESYAC